MDLALEYLYTTASRLKWGIGIGYSLSRSVSFSNSEKQVFEDLGLDEIKVSAYPIYVTLQFYPIKNLENLYLKGNLGLAILHIKPSYDDIINSFRSGQIAVLDNNNTYFGVYYGLGLGYDLPSGLFFEILYDFSGNVSNGKPKEIYIGNTLAPEINYTFSKLSLSVVYKFKL
ncbi:outer membrane beta-barrel protein [Candidatus Endomicrobiellum cubanum]|uniref:outer membrane beta-barrel protein n=1 Tax=Candidatus Endomicrobiellum cubanum TaxID=3242325 RepID=UPI0035933773